jgi:hypothetical protein
MRKSAGAKGTAAAVTDGSLQDVGRLLASIGDLGQYLSGALKREGEIMNYPRLALAAVSALIVFFAWGFLTEGLLLRRDFVTSAALYRTSDKQMKYMPFGVASVLVALFAAVALYARWCGSTSGAMRGLQFGILMGIFVACIHPISNLIIPRLLS